MSWKEKDFEEKMRQSIDNIYYDIFGDNLKSINRSNRDDNKNEITMILDKDLGVDTILRFKNGAPITVQEKTLQYTNHKFNALTYEYYNDPKIKDEGDWFKLVAQLYFFGYANPDHNGYYNYWLIDVAALHININNGNINIYNYIRSNNYPSKANFFAIPLAILEQLPNVVIFSKQLKNKTI